MPLANRIILFLLLLASIEVKSQTVTDPSVLIPGYDSIKQSNAKNGGIRQNNKSFPSPVANAGRNKGASLKTLAETCLIPLDTGFTAVPRNDDGSFGPLQLPFDFDLYGVRYNQVWINTNGNLTFTGAVSQYVASGFPIGVPMVAAYWADIDTRGFGSGEIHYKLNATNLIVTWDSVGYFSQGYDKLNTFQIIIGAQGDSLLGPGNNVKFNYADVQWTTSAGPGGNPSTVGVNSGDGINYIQVGRFNRDDDFYDGPGDQPDGINYLDGKCFSFNVSSNSNVAPLVTGLPSGNQITLDVGDTVNLPLQFVGPEVGQNVSVTVDTGNMCKVKTTITNGELAKLNIRVIGSACNLGVHNIRITATDDGTPVAATTINLKVTVRSEQVISFPGLPDVVYEPGGTVTLGATSSSGLPITYTVVRGPVSTSGNTAQLNGVGTVTIRASQEGNEIYYPANSKQITFCILPNMPGAIVGDTSVCFNATTTYQVAGVSGATFAWTVSGGDLTQNGNRATVNWKALGTHTLSVSYTGNCGGSSPVRTLTVEATNTPLVGPFRNLLPMDGNTDLVLPITFSWFPISGAVAYDIYIWNQNDPEPTTPAYSNIKAINYTVYNSTLLEPGKTYKWKVAAKKACYELASSVQSFRLRYLPDLVVSGIQTPASGFSGQNISVTWQVKNIGLGSTLSAPWTDAVYLSLDTVLNLTEDYLLGRVTNASALEPNQVYSQTGSFKLPNGINDKYHVFVVTNTYNQLAETETTNNKRVGTATAFIQLTPPPDLKVTAIVPPNNAFSGQPINVTWTVKNTGTGPTVSGFWYDHLYLSKNDSLNLSEAVDMGVIAHSGELGVGGSYSQTQEIQLPEGVFGDYFVFVTTDYYNNVYEHAQEQNNTTRSSAINVVLTPPIDLVVSGVSGPASANNRQTVAIDWTVQNAGGSATEGRGWYDYIYLSESSSFNANTAIPLATVYKPKALEPGDSYSQHYSLTMPANLTGNYYVFVVTDAGNQVFEYTYENNNTARSSQPINIKTPDLLVSSVTVPSTDTSGNTISLSWIVKNNGPGALVSAQLTDQLFLSTATQFNSQTAIPVGQISYNKQLNAGDTAVLAAQVKLPNGLSGTHYLYVQTDYPNAVYEAGSENNNTKRSTAPIAVVLGPYPDLQVSNVQVTDTAKAGSLTPVSFVVVNKGTRNTRESRWADRLFISQGASWDSAAATFVREIAHEAVLAKDSSYTVNTDIKLPGDAAAGKYYVYVTSDAANEVYEHTAEGNNRKRSSSAVFVKEYPPVDLVMTSFTAPSSGGSGKPIAINWTVANKGLAVTLPSQWADALYLSTDTVFDKNSDILVNEYIHRRALEPNQSYSVDENFVLPNGVSGNYYLLLVADHEDVNNDANRRNNYKLITGTGSGGGNPVKVTITLTPPPDLVVSSFVVPGQGSAGQPITVNYKVKNTGTGATTTGTWTDKLFLSTDLELDGSDQLIGTVVHTGKLDPSGSYDSSFQAFLPISAFGNYAVILKTDANNALYEHEAEGNNTATSIVSVTTPAVSDLVVSGISLPPTAMTGDTVTIGWSVKNTGAFPATGYLTEGIYLSEDSVKDAGDILLASVDGFLSLSSGAEESRSYTGELKGVSLKAYHVLVHTDLKNNIYESNDANNVGVSAGRLKVTVPLLPINVTTVKHAGNNREFYYRIEIPDSAVNESFLITLRGDSARGANEMYLRHGEVPTRAVYDFAYSLPYGGNQEIVVPELQPGIYYLMVVGNTTAGDAQDISLLAQVLRFGIRSADAAAGGNTGPVTVLLQGSKFSNVAAVRLRNGSVVIPADSIHIVNAAKLYATFNLKDKALGVYDVVAENSKHDTTALHAGFRIERGTAVNLVTNVNTPPNIRRDNIMTMTVQYTNAGNTDLIDPVLKLSSLGGAAIAFSIAELSNDSKELTLSLQEVNGPKGVLRPGASGVIVVYAKASANLIFTLTQKSN